MIKSEHRKTVITTSPVALSLGYSEKALVYADFNCICHAIIDEFGLEAFAVMLLIMTEEVDEERKEYKGV